MWSPVPAINATLNGNLLGTIRVSNHFIQSWGNFMVSCNVYLAGFYVVYAEYMVGAAG